MSAMEDVYPTSTSTSTPSVASTLIHQPSSSSTPLPMIKCPLCGIDIESNPSNMCINCLKSKVDITEGITKQCTLFWCRNCGRYQRPPWVDVQLESREMLAMCLKKIKGLNKDVKLVDAGFIWTEPHSKRIKVKLTIQKEVFNSAILQQIFVVEFVIQNQQCTDCQKSYTEHTWTAMVQLRQKVKHKKTMFYLEQLLLKHGVVERAIQVKSQPDGLDVYWSGRSGAMKLLDFLRGVVPIKSTASKKLVSQDLNSNIANYKYTLNAEIAPICKDDLVLLEPRLQHQLGGVSPILLVIRVTATITMIDPITLKVVEVSGGTYFHHPFRALLSAKQMTEYTVLDIEKVDLQGKDKNSSIQDHRSFNKQTLVYNAKLAQAHVTLARTSDLGTNDMQFESMTHLGNLLQAGDTVMGYDLTNANWNDQVPLTRGKELPDVILVRKSYPMRKNRQRKRQFELKQLPKEQGDKVMKKSDIAREEEEMEDFIRDIEEDPELQSKVNLYKRKNGNNTDVKEEDMGEEDEDEDGFPTIPMDQLLEDMGNVQIGLHDGTESESDMDDETFLRHSNSDGSVTTTTSSSVGPNVTSTGPSQLSKPK